MAEEKRRNANSKKGAEDYNVSGSTTPRRVALSRKSGINKKDPCRDMKVPSRTRGSMLGRLARVLWKRGEKQEIGPKKRSKYHRKQRLGEGENKKEDRRRRD